MTATGSPVRFVRSRTRSFVAVPASPPRPLATSPPIPARSSRVRSRAKSFRATRKSAELPPDPLRSNRYEASVRCRVSTSETAAPIERDHRVRSPARRAVRTPLVLAGHQPYWFFPVPDRNACARAPPLRHASDGNGHSSPAGRHGLAPRDPPQHHAGSPAADDFRAESTVQAAPSQRMLLTERPRWPLRPQTDSTGEY